LTTAVEADRLVSVYPYAGRKKNEDGVNDGVSPNGFISAGIVFILYGLAYNFGNIARRVWPNSGERMSGWRDG